ncbi:Negative elongation factor B [Lucilia cuprina]|uniref:Negative elongation factor B n=1 Tax=Lucilia cuprina TaxID=7375 RepID=A0A0L0CBE1_LUCCU|nr:negative elongation factor B [Lucilia cuprina]XP_046802917.1 negative elongation factor B [Lucilia cuprina]KNC28784.1 Negative elongation factor B [Lucilia cuprina]
MAQPPPKFTGTGLEEVNIPGQAYLREALTSCTDPLKAIESFQLENGVLLPSLRPMLPLLDLHGVRRLDFHTSLMEELRDKLIAHINDLGQKDPRERDKKLKELLVKSFPVVRVKALRPVVMAILRNTPHIDDKYLRILVRDRELYADTDTEVKRQIWRDNQSLFGDEVSPLLSQYIREKEHILFDHTNLNNLFFHPSPKVRRQGEVVQKLANMIGTSVKLYDMVLQFLRTLFLRTRNVHYCTLRAELLMALHDLEVQEIISVDPCHKFTWCLDACIREKNVDIKRSRELQGFLDNIKRGQEQVLGDLSMTLCDPYAINFLATSAIKILQHLINNESLPRDNTILILLLRMLALGLSAWVMIDSQDFKEPKLDSQVVTKFLPALMSLMVDDQCRSLHSKLPPDERESALTTIEHSGPAPDAVEAYIQESSVASILAMYYTLNTARQKDRVGVLRVLAILSSCKDDRAYEDPFLHSLIALLIPMAEEFTTEDFCTTLFDEFLFAGLTRDNVTRHMIKLLWYVHNKLPPGRLQSLMKAMQPTTGHNETVHKLYETLQERIGTSLQECPVPEPTETDFDSPLKSVPTPGPHYMQ